MKLLKSVLRIRNLAFGAACGLCLAGYSRAAEVKTKLAIPLFLKIVSYDHSFSGEEKPDTLRVYFLYEFSRAKSYQQFQETREFFRANNGLSVSGTPVKFIGIQKRDGDSTVRSVPDSPYSVVICATGCGEEFRSLSPTLISGNCRSFAISSEDMAAGIAVSVEAKVDKTAIVVSLRAAKAEGSRFSPKFLSMCTIVDRPR